MKCTWKTTLWQGEAGFSAIATSLLLRRSAWHFFYYVLPDTRRIKRINKDMKLILYSPGIWVIHSRFVTSLGFGLCSIHYYDRWIEFQHEITLVMFQRNLDRGLGRDKWLTRIIYIPTNGSIVAIQGEPRRDLVGRPLRGQLGEAFSTAMYR